jgi:hypothetical protein
MYSTHFPHLKENFIHSLRFEHKRRTCSKRQKSRFIPRGDCECRFQLLFFVLLPKDDETDLKPVKMKIFGAKIAG